MSQLYKRVWCKFCNLWVKVSVLGETFICPLCNNFIKEREEDESFQESIHE
jgi:hypothetical protein